MTGTFMWTGAISVAADQVATVAAFNKFTGADKDTEQFQTPGAPEAPEMTMSAISAEKTTGRGPGG